MSGHTVVLSIMGKILQVEGFVSIFLDWPSI